MPTSSRISPDERIAKRATYNREYRKKRRAADRAKKVTMQDLYDRAGVVIPEKKPPRRTSVEAFIESLKS